MRARRSAYRRKLMVKANPKVKSQIELYRVIFVTTLRIDLWILHGRYKFSGRKLVWMVLHMYVWHVATIC